MVRLKGALPDPHTRGLMTDDVFFCFWPKFGQQVNSFVENGETFFILLERHAQSKLSSLSPGEDTSWDVVDVLDLVQIFP